jgi:hypothetical protein
MISMNSLWMESVSRAMGVTGVGKFHLYSASAARGWQALATTIGEASLFMVSPADWGPVSRVRIYFSLEGIQTTTQAILFITI